MHKMNKISPCLGVEPGTYDSRFPTGAYIGLRSRVRTWMSLGGKRRSDSFHVKKTSNVGFYDSLYDQQIRICPTEGSWSLARALRVGDQLLT